MLDLARLTPRDYLIDLGSGDGRFVIAAAKRGARALGVEYNPDLIEVSRRTAAIEGVAERATFVQGDLYQADISEATVLALFLMPDMLSKLRAKFLELTPGTRIVSHHFAIDGWEANEIERIEGGSPRYCTALLYVVPSHAPR
ncbi:MAG: class I SAM-dependent methyltransferase [Burkholderiales bacterium]